MTKSMIAAALAAAGLGLLAPAAGAADILSQQCVACHAVTKPEKTSVERLWERKAPDLYYAGAKFNKAWLVSWLQNPTTLRAGGTMFAKVLKPGADGAPDTVDSAQVPSHPKLSAADAALAADALMALKPAGLVAPGAYKKEPLNASMASMLFSKLRGCTSCHTAKPGGAPTSAPELHTAGDRLQPDYVVAYIKDPQKFDAHTWMPTLGLNDADIQKLTGHIGTLKGEKK